ncbi:MAG: hypothetical protein ACI9J3_000363 [Parvicellaceae bacterium]|jgi:hypothetical protein
MSENSIEQQKLDLEKTKFELSKSQQKKQGYITLLKFVIGTLILGTLTLVVNHNISVNNLELEEAKVENQHLQSFTDSYMKMSDQERVGYLELYSDLSTNQNFKGKYEAILLTLRKRMDAKKELLLASNEAKNESQMLRDSTEIMNLKITELESQEAQGDQVKSRIRAMKKALEKENERLRKKEARDLSIQNALDSIANEENPAHNGFSFNQNQTANQFSFPQSENQELIPIINLWNSNIYKISKDLRQRAENGINVKTELKSLMQNQILPFLDKYSEKLPVCNSDFKNLSWSWFEFNKGGNRANRPLIQDIFKEIKSIKSSLQDLKTRIEA